MNFWINILGNENLKKPYNKGMHADCQIATRFVNR